MAALLHSYPQPSNTITMHQKKTSSTSEILSKNSTNHINHHSISNKSHIQRINLQGIKGSKPLSNYRSQPLVTAIAPYAFTSTPNLNTPGHSTAPKLDTETQVYLATNCSARKGQLENKIQLFTPRRASNGQKICFTNDITVNRPSSAVTSSTSSNQSFTHQNPAQQSLRSSPGRYRRTHAQSIDSSNSFGSADSQLDSKKLEPQLICSFQDFSLQMPQLPNFIHESPLTGHQEDQRYGSLQNKDKTSMKSPISSLQSQPAKRLLMVSSGEDISHQQPSPSKGSYSPRKHDDNNGKLGIPGKSLSVDSSVRREENAVNNEKVSNAGSYSLGDKPKISLEIPGSHDNNPRLSSADNANRVFNPSPLSKPMPINSESVATKESFTSAVNAALKQPTTSVSSHDKPIKSSSPAAAQLSALNRNDGKRSKNSRLRRAFSFGSAAELRNATNLARNSNETRSDSFLRSEEGHEGLDAEQTRIAQQQEAGGIGSGIYTGQGNFFSASTDNLSISSTASSASIMIRKMGKGMKKSTRSLVGLFRPKNTGRGASSDAAPQTTETRVSLVSVEAELGNVHPKNPSLLTESSISASLVPKKNALVSGTEQPSMDSVVNTEVEIVNSQISNNSDKERTDILAGVKKGILKKSGLGTEIPLKATPTLNSSMIVFQKTKSTVSSDSPNSTAPSTPKDCQNANLRSVLPLFGNEDYFTPASRHNRSPTSHSSALLNGCTKRNTTFSPRIQFHDTWPSGEYDRRGEIATCNRLTPMLAQQIKEELNTFKMEMEVHENSKIYTHFF